MPLLAADPERRTGAGEAAVLAVVLVVAAAARMWFLGAGVPHAVGIDEPQVVDRAIRILRTGDWNTHLFDYPSLVIYLHAGVAIARFLWGAVNGEWASLDGFSIAAIYGTARLTSAALGVATVWFTWRLARELSSRSVALLAAAQLAVMSLHVRESHYALTDVPMTLLTTITLWLAVRASRHRSVTAYAWAGAFAGLAAAAKYNGGIVVLAPLAAWAVYERGATDRAKKIAAIVGAATIAFLVGAPYTLLDMPAFLDGFAAQFSRFAAPVASAEAPWRTYLKHLSPAAMRWWVPLGAAGIVDVLWRRGTRAAWAPVLVFLGAFFYVLSSHSHVFGRYALPLVPVLCILSSIALVELIRLVSESALLPRAARKAIVVAVVLFVVGSEAAFSIDWLDGLRRADTRAMAADWLAGNAPKGARVVVENSGPTYLDAAGFRVIGTQIMPERPLDWLRQQRAAYLVISSGDLSRYSDYLAAGDTVFQVTPTPQRWGPPIRIVKVR